MLHMWAVRGMCPLWSVMCTIWILCGASKELWFRNFQKSVWCRTLQVAPLRPERDSCLCDLDLSSRMCSILLTKHFLFSWPNNWKKHYQFLFIGLAVLWHRISRRMPSASASPTTLRRTVGTPNALGPRRQIPRAGWRKSCAFSVYSSSAKQRPIIWHRL